MKYERYLELKRDLESYFSTVIKERFKHEVEENMGLDIAADFATHELVEKLLGSDGFDVYGMSVNMDRFQLHLEFNHEYKSRCTIPFSYVSVDFVNDGNYSVDLDSDCFERDWTVNLEDGWLSLEKVSEDEFVELLENIRKSHLLVRLKN